MMIYIINYIENLYDISGQQVKISSDYNKEKVLLVIKIIKRKKYE